MPPPQDLLHGWKSTTFHINFRRLRSRVTFIGLAVTVPDFRVCRCAADVNVVSGASVSADEV